MAVWWAYISRGEEAETGMWGADEQPLSDKPALIRCGETYRTWQ